MWPLETSVSTLLAAPFVGSFLSVLVIRLPKGEGVVWGRSQCPACSRTLGPTELIPVASWLLQSGKCAGCSAPISTLYPAMEIAATLLAAWAVVTVDPGVVLVTALLGWTLLALAVMDARSFFLSDWLTLPLIPAGLAVGWWLEPDALTRHIAGMVAGFTMLVLVSWTYKRARGRDGLGFGDAKLMAAAGAWLGLAGLGSVLLMAVSVNVVMLGVARILGQRIDARTPVPFGTGIAAGLWLTWLYGPISFTG